MQDGATVPMFSFIAAGSASRNHTIYTITATYQNMVFNIGNY